jgi:putative endonuclease
MAMRAKDVLGKSGEQEAAKYLESHGLRILDRNWRSADGEIDIVAVERQVLVVCEVKSRTSVRYGSPLEAVSRAKRARLRRLAVQWLNAHGIRFDQVRLAWSTKARADSPSSTSGEWASRAAGPHILGRPGGRDRPCGRDRG